MSNLPGMNNFGGMGGGWGNDDQTNADLTKGQGVQQDENNAGAAALAALPPTASQSQRMAAEQAARKGVQGQEGFTDNGTKAVNPGSADVGGYAGAGQVIHDTALGYMRQGDKAYDANAAALNQSLSNMQGGRGNMANEDPTLVARQNATRGMQMDALGLARAQALGTAPSAAARQTEAAQQAAMEGSAAAKGGARGLSALGSAQNGQALGMASSNAATAGGLARSKEIQNGLGMYGSQASGVVGGDLARQQQSDQMAQFNAGLNNQWQLGNADLAAKQGALGNQQENLRGAWYDASTRPAEMQAQFDQTMQGMQNGQSAAEAQAAINAAQAENARNAQIGQQLGATTFGMIGTAAGGPAGGAVGSTFGGMGGSYFGGQRY
jgi:hypothetical protein